MRCVVTGAAGFIGGHLSRCLIDEGHEVVGIDLMTDYYDVEQKLSTWNGLLGDRFTPILADLGEMDLLDVFSGVDVVFHLAGQPGVRASWGSDFGSYVASNVTATQRLLQALLEFPQIKRVVVASSSSVYGDAEKYPTSESAIPRPRSPYGVTKLAAEHLSKVYAANFGLPTVALRYFTVYGPRQRPDMAFQRFIRAALVGDEIVVYGNGEQVRDFTYVHDVVRATMQAGNAVVAPGAVYNVAGGSSASVNEVLDLIEGIVGPVRRRYVEAAAGDVTRTGADTTAIRAELGWEPRVSLREGIERQVAHLRSNL